MRLVSARTYLVSLFALGMGCYTGIPEDQLGGDDNAFGDATGEAGDGDTFGDGDGDGDGDGSGTGDGDSGTTGGDGDGDSGTTGGDGDGDGDSGTTGGDGDSDSGTTGGDGDGDGDGDSGTTGGDGDDPDVPNNGYCQEVANWNAGWAAKEVEILNLVNQVRGQGQNCGSQGNFGPTGPLSMDPALRCAARKHSKDMNDRNFFDHINPDGETPWDRMGMAGYNWTNAGENIAGGNAGAQATMNQWLNSDGHCANIMNPDFEDIGVGYYPGGQWGHLWTQVFGAQ